MESIEKVIEELSKKVESLESTVKLQREKITRVESDLFHTKYYLTIAMPTHQHYFKD